MPIFIVTGQVAKDKRAALGNVCVQWAILEQRVEQVIWAFQGIDRKAGRRITAHMSSIRPRVNRILKEANNSTLTTRDKPALNRLACHIKDDLALERNWAVHGLWGKGLERGMRRNTYAISYFRDPSGDCREMFVAYLNDLAKRTSATTYLLGKFITKKLGVRLP